MGLSQDHKSCCKNKLQPFVLGQRQRSYRMLYGFFLLKLQKRQDGAVDKRRARGHHCGLPDEDGGDLIHEEIRAAVV